MFELNKFKNPKNFRGRNKIIVQLWWIVQATFFALSPQVLYPWRRFLLRLFGAKIGKQVVIRPNVKITYPWKVIIGDYSWIGDDVVLYSLGEIQIGSNTVISQKSYLCTGSHEYQKQSFDIYNKPIIIKDSCWIATDVFIAPGVTIENEIVVGARSSVFTNLYEKGVYIGNPAKKVK
ncbi:putative glycose-acyl transferase [Flavobacterium sp. 9AF]|uniref:putative colanic acid biosynthesis acetyltransferase n=1 Tax=Flavobacterium sp. 9AF TaxID=2653142 RepID=UPI0012EFC54A|nr:putative colanic acid biosynthesis acetyltransferase [Flavobacterium sp. 9AF]VXC02647.1 putative glycose-acyl transferase [Flavobacterium sp. 9AF]